MQEEDTASDEILGGSSKLIPSYLPNEEAKDKRMKAGARRLQPIADGAQAVEGSRARS